MKILLLGANGQVGTELRRSLAPLGELVFATRNGTLPDGIPCETADFDAPASLQGLVERIGPDVVVNAAAYTAVDRAETERDAAFRANAQAPGVLARACAARDALLVHYSTDYVFDGTADAPYVESSATGPAGVYGASKLAGEQAVRDTGVRHAILRTAWVYAAHGHNFLRTMLRIGAERDELRVVADQVGTPTPAVLIAEATAAMLRNADRAALDGTWHVTASGSTSWHGFAEAIFAGAVARGLLPNAPHVQAIATADYPTPARRPAWSVLDNRAFQRDFGVVLPDWHVGLDAVLDDLAARAEA